jgi:Transposase domain (DUF772)
MRHAADRLSVRWYVGYDLDEPLPNHSSLTRIRERYGVEVFRRFFEKIVEQCQEAGLVWGKELYIDGTKVEANASLDSLKPRFAVEAHLANMFAEEDEQAAEQAFSHEQASSKPVEQAELEVPMHLPVPLSQQEYEDLPSKILNVTTGLSNWERKIAASPAVAISDSLICASVRPTRMRR